MGKMQRIGFSQVTSSVALWFRGSFRRFSGKGGGRRLTHGGKGKRKGEGGGPGAAGKGRDGRDGERWHFSCMT